MHDSSTGDLRTLVPTDKQVDLELPKLDKPAACYMTGLTPVRSGGKTMGVVCNLRDASGKLFHVSTRAVGGAGRQTVATMGVSYGAGTDGLGYSIQIFCE